MPSKSERSCFSRFAKARGAQLTLGLLALLGAQSASATFTLQTIPDSRLTSGRDAWYQVTVPTGGFLDSGAGFTTLVPTVTAATDPGFGNAIKFKITSTSTTTASATPLAIIATIKLADNTEAAIPIAAVDGVACSGINCGSLLNGYYRSAFYTQNATTTISIYPTDICLYVQSSLTSTVTGCTTGALTPDTATPPNYRISVGVQIKALDTAVPPEPTGNAIEKTVADIAINYRGGADGISLTGCTDETKNKIYFPGDKEVILTTDLLSLGSRSGGAPATTLIVVAKAGNGVPTLDSTFASANTLMGRFPNNLPNALGGFENSDTPTDHLYGLGFMVRDAAGIVANDTACAIQGVQTSEIQGFLKKSSCFIATGAFRSTDAEPVMLLREFRDEVLLESAPGRAFVDWYYSWSPPAAEWLMRHPSFRYPVLLMLAPVQTVAWLALHSLLLAIFAFSGLAVLASVGLLAVASRGVRR